MDYYQRIFEKTIEHRIPFIVHWELTYRCNLKCQHCYVAREAGSRELTTQEIKRILKALAQAQALFLIWSGGEVLCREDFLEIIRFAHHLGFAQRIFSNGTQLNNKMIKEIKRIHPISVEISLYGINPATHEKITRVKGSFKKSLKALFRLKEEGVNTAIKFMAFKENLEEFKAVEDLSRRIKAKFVYDFNLAPRQDGSLEPTRFRLNNQDLENFIRRRPINLERLSYKSPEYLLCNAGVNNLSVSPSGDVYPCVGIREKVGNVLEDTLEKIMKAPLLEKLRERKAGYLTDCQNCQLVPYCNRCYGIAQLEDGNLWGKSNQACQVARVVKKVIEERAESLHPGGAKILG